MTCMARWKRNSPVWSAWIVTAAMIGCADGGSEDDDTTAGGDQVAEAREPLADQPFTQDQGPRTIQPVAYDTAWSFGGPGDTLLASPQELDVASDGGLYVLDVQAQKVLRIESGRLAWAWGAPGQGPGELGGARAMTVDLDTDAPVLVDTRNRRIVWLSADGTLLREEPFTGQALSTLDMVALADGSGYVASILGMSGMGLMRIPSDGGEPAIVTPDWSGFREMEILALDMLVFARSGTSWGLAFKTGPGFFLVAADGARAHSYVERVEFPEVEVRVDTTNGAVQSGMRFAGGRPTPSAYDLDTMGDTLFVLTHDSDNEDRGIIDLYSMTSGEYLESRPLPGRYRWFALAGDTTYVVDGSGPGPVLSILALVAREGQP